MTVSAVVVYCKIQLIHPQSSQSRWVVAELCCGCFIQHPNNSILLCLGNLFCQPQCKWQMKINWWG